MTAEHTTGQFELSALEFDVLTEHLGLEALPLVLKVPSPGRTHTERAELVDSAWRSLSARGLGRASDLDPELARMVRLLARPQREIDGRAWFGRSVRVLAAGDGQTDAAVLAVKDGDTLTLRPAATTGLPREAVSVLPRLPAGPGKSVTLRSADLDAAVAEAGQIRELGASLRRRGVRGEDAEVLPRMLREADARGQFGAAARNRVHRRSRSAHVVGFFDTPRGRYVQLRRDSPSGDTWSTVAPVDTRRIIAHLDELLTDVTAP